MAANFAVARGAGRGVASFTAGDGKGRVRPADGPFSASRRCHAVSLQSRLSEGATPGAFPKAESASAAAVAVEWASGTLGSASVRRLSPLTPTRPVADTVSSIITHHIKPFKKKKY